MPERENPPGQEFEQRFHDLYHTFFSDFETYVTEAEELKADLQVDQLPQENEEAAELWDELVVSHRSTRHDWERRRESIDENMRAALEKSLNELKESAEEVFGKKLE